MCEMGEVLLWDLDSLSVSRTLTTGARGDVKALRFGPGSGKLSWIDSNNRYGTFSISDDENPPLAGTVAPRVKATTLSADGRLAAHAQRHSVQVWDTVAGRPMGQALEGLRQPIYAVAFSPEDKLLAAAGCGHSDRYRGGCVYDALQLWQVDGQQRLGPALIAPGEHLGELTFGPDAKTLVSGSRERELVFWDLDPDSWRQRACRIANRSLSALEAERYLGGPDAPEVCSSVGKTKR